MKPNYPITPAMIDTTTRFWSTFGNLETEISARYLVQLAQAKGDWSDFTRAEIDAFAKENFHFNRLDENFITRRGENTFGFTHKFIATCFLSRPTPELVASEAMETATK